MQDDRIKVFQMNGIGCEIMADFVGFAHVLKAVHPFQMVAGFKVSYTISLFFQI